ncbi:MAG: hypothetical protein N5P05_004476 (plasmid) [Chroococcopsis gigantea SAG 12.99]|jgi:hypothetical protein|nr:hypothetical protein [Chroococcopsis gigantea SAG 12.99]
MNGLFLEKNQQKSLAQKNVALFNETTCARSAGVEIIFTYRIVKSLLNRVKKQWYILMILHIKKQIFNFLLYLI